MKKTSTLLFLLPFLALTLFSCGNKPEPDPDPRVKYGTDFYSNYYDDVTSWTNSADLKSKLYSIIREGYTSLPYSSPNWETNQYADQDLTFFDEVNVVYSATNNLKTATNKSGNGGWQREHAFAASLMTGQLTAAATSVNSGRATDFHNLFASYYAGNSSRGNKNFGIADTTSASYVSAGNDINGIGDYSFDELNFEPGNVDKGRISRAIFYMGVMYSIEETVTISGTQYTYQPLTIQEDYVTYSATSCSYAIGNLSTLLTWNALPVDRMEYQHNESVYSHIYSGTSSAQGNRNPFVDYPELVDYVYGSKKDTAGELTYLKPSCLSLETSSTDDYNYALSTVKRSYEVGETFSKTDYALVKVGKDFSISSELDFTDTTADYTFLESDLTAKTKTITIVTPINTITYKVNVVSSDPMVGCSYNYTLTGKAGGGDLSGFTNGNNVTLGGTPWNIAWTNTSAAIGNRSSTLGVAFGSGTASVNSLTFTTVNELTNVDGFYAKVTCAANKTISYSLSISDIVLVSSSYARPSGSDAPTTIGASLETPVTGKLTLTINGTGASSGAVYIYSLAYNLVA